MSDDGGWRSRRGPAKPAKKEEVVDLAAAFGISFGNGSDSSDAEFAPEDAPMDSEDSHESEADDEADVGEGDGDKGGDDDDKGDGDKGDGDGDGNKGDGDGTSQDEPKVVDATKEQSSGAEVPYNPLIVRRSQRAIKPTKDIDLYLLGAQFGVDVEGSDADSSDLEFAPEAASDAGSDLSSSSANASSVEVGAKAPSDAEMSSVQQMPEAPQNFEIPLCSVCLEDSGEDGDLVECDRCGIAVHEGCYGIPEEEDHIREDGSDLSSFTTVPWFCDPCKAGLNSSLSHCDLCPNTGGLFKQTINGRWVHVVCMLYTPSIEYMEPSLLSGVTLDQLPASRWGSKVCQLCDNVSMSRTGVCIGCDAGLCKSSFHATCAQQHGLLCEVDSGDEDKELCDPFFAHCKAHAEKEVAKRKRRDYLTVIKKHKTFEYDESDERIQHYLEEAKVRYTRFFEKMQNYYQPENVFHGEDRWLHTVPSAVKRLSMKAKLLGHVSEDTTGESRRKIAPALTTDFVSYFHERQGQIQSLQKQEQHLNSAHQHLEVEQVEVRGQLGALQRSLRSIQSTGQELRSKASLLHLHLAKLGVSQDWEHAVSLEEEGASVMEDGSALQCSVCAGTEEQHLMTLCDTCNKRYHIGCLDPPLAKVPKKSAKWGWQCHNCCHDSEDELTPIMANFDEPASRSGRKIKIPKTLSYPDYQVKPVKKRKKK